MSLLNTACLRQSKIEELVYRMGHLTLADNNATSGDLANRMNKLSLSDASPLIGVDTSDDDLFRDLIFRMLKLSVSDRTP